MLPDALHELPLKVATSPPAPPSPTAAQNAADGHDTDPPKKAGSIGVGADHPLDANAGAGPTSISSPTIPPTKAAYHEDCLAPAEREACILTCPSSFRLQASTANSSRTLITASAQSRRSGRGLVDKLISAPLCHLGSASALPRRATIRWESRPQRTILLPFKTEYKRGLPPLLNRSTLATTRASAPSRG
jgi:hypothetical protein